LIIAKGKSDEAVSISKFEDYESLDASIGTEKAVSFLHQHLEQYGDSKDSIRRAIDYAFSQEEGKGGFLLVATKRGELAGVVVMNDTGMKGYIPEHILVYIAVERKTRGTGIGRRLLKRVKELCTGDIALHVEENNPARFLYRRLGFKTKYREMRLVRSR
jgi:GNAT superfamily N-acetyltransferase